MKLNFGIVQAAQLLSPLIGTNRTAHLIVFLTGNIGRQSIIPLSILLGLRINPQHTFKHGVLFPLGFPLLLLQVFKFSFLS
jgi:hypothetical protein